jgi:hypothetical protein
VFCRAVGVPAGVPSAGGTASGANDRMPNNLERGGLVRRDEPAWVACRDIVVRGFSLRMRDGPQGCHTTWCGAVRRGRCRAGSGRRDWPSRGTRTGGRGSTSGDKANRWRRWRSRGGDFARFAVPCPAPSGSPPLAVIATPARPATSGGFATPTAARPEGSTWVSPQGFRKDAVQRGAVRPGTVPSGAGRSGGGRSGAGSIV